MPTISPALSEIIKRHLFRAREHLQCFDAPSDDIGEVFQHVAQATYEFNRGMKLPAVKHLEGQPGSVYRDDAVRNFSIVIDVDLTQLEMPPGQVEQAVTAAREICSCTQAVPLPERPRS